MGIETSIVVILVILLIIILLVAVLWSLQKGYIFNQDSEVTWQPEDTDYVLVDGKISLWHRDSYPGRPLVLYCHGSGGNISDLRFMSDISRKGKFNVVLFDYQGYGYSSGSGLFEPTQASVLDDGLRVYDWVAKRYQAHEIILWGHSLGGAVVSYIAKQRACHSVILMSTFSSLSDVAGMKEGTSYQMGQYLIKYGTHNMNVKEWLKDVKVPVILLHSPDDDLIPHRCAQENFKSVDPDISRMMDIGGTHTSPSISEEIVIQLFEMSGLYSKDLDEKYANDICGYVKQAGEHYERRRPISHK